MSDATKLCNDIASMIPYSVSSKTRFSMKEKLLFIQGAIEKLEVENDTFKKQLEQKDKYIEELELLRAAGATTKEEEIVAAVIVDGKPAEVIVETPPETKTEVVETVEVENKVAVVETTPVQ